MAIHISVLKLARGLLARQTRENAINKYLSILVLPARRQLAICANEL
jgi:hypothetical protein